MPMHQVIQEESQRSLMKYFGHIEANQKQAYTLIRTCRRLQSTYHDLKHPQRLIDVLKKVEEKLQSLTTESSNKSAKGSPITTGDLLEDFQRLYESSDEAKGEWNKFQDELKKAAEYDQKRHSKLQTLRSLFKKKEWPLDKTSDREMVFIFPPDFNVKSELIRESLKLHKDSTFEEVIWLFSRRETHRIPLQKNMQFYDTIKIDKKTGLLKPAELPSEQQYYVLVDRTVRILFDLRKPRIFGNMWDLNGTIVLKEFNGIVMESEVARKGVLVNIFHVNSRTSRRLNWQLAMKSALEELDKIEEQSQGRDNILYTVQSADPEPEPSPTSSTRSSIYLDCSEENDTTTDESIRPGQATTLPSTSSATHSLPLPSTNVAPTPMPVPSVPARRDLDQVATGHNSVPTSSYQPALRASQPVTARANSSLPAQLVPPPRTPFPATLTNSQSVSFPVAVTFPQPSPAPIRPLRNLRTANAIPSKPASAAPPHRSLNDTSTVNVAATVQTFEAQTPQTHPVKASVPPPQRGWVRRLVDRFTR